jgi:hypothetical protein
MAMTAPVQAERRARVVIFLGAVGVVVGVALTGSGQGNGAGGVVLLFGWLALVFGIHRFGRLGTP